MQLFFDIAIVKPIKPAAVESHSHSTRISNDSGTQCPCIDYAKGPPTKAEQENYGKLGPKIKTNDDVTRDGRRSTRSASPAFSAFHNIQRTKLPSGLSDSALTGRR